MRTQNWFIEPLNDHTNQVCASFVGEENAGHFRAINGKVVKAWELTASERNTFISHELSMNLRFRVWRKRRIDGKLEHWRGHRPWDPLVQLALAR